MIARVCQTAEEEEKSRESPIPATHEVAEAGGAHKAKAKAKEGEPEAEAGHANFKTADAYFAVLCRAKADGFAIQVSSSEEKRGRGQKEAERGRGGQLPSQRQLSRSSPLVSLLACSGPCRRVSDLGVQSHGQSGGRVQWFVTEIDKEAVAASRAACEHPKGHCKRAQVLGVAQLNLTFSSIVRLADAQV